MSQQPRKLGAEYPFSNTLYVYLYGSLVYHEGVPEITPRDFETIYKACSQLLQGRQHINGEVLCCLLLIPDLKVNQFYTHFLNSANEIRSSADSESKLKHEIKKWQTKINRVQNSHHLEELDHQESTIKKQITSPIAWLVASALESKDYRGEYTDCIDISVRTTFQNFLERQKVAYDERILEVTVDDRPIGNPEDYYDTEAFPILRQAWDDAKVNRPPIASLDNGQNLFLQSLKAKARQNRFHPVEQFLNKLPKVNLGYIKGFCKLMGLKHNSFESAMVTKWLVSAISRALNPGAQVDTMLVIQGPKGLGKSRTIRLLSSPTEENWYYQVGSGGSKDETMACHKSWISNYDELAFLKSEKNRNELKEWLTKTVDTFRAPFERKPEDFPRRFVFCGTTNDLEFLSSDPALQRRFLAVSVTSMPSEKWLKANVVNVWAEAKQLHDEGYQHWFTPEQERQHESHMSKYTGVDLQEDLALQIITYLAFNYNAVPQIELSRLLVKYDKALENRVKRGQAIQRAMEQLKAPGNYKAQPSINGARVPVYLLPEVNHPGTFCPLETEWDNETGRPKLGKNDSLQWECPILSTTPKFHRNPTNPEH